MPTEQKLRWWQVSLRSLLFGLFVLSLPLGYVASERRNSERGMAAVRALEKLDARISYDYEIPRRSAIMRALLGDDSYKTVYSVSYGYYLDDNITDADLAPLTEFTSIGLLRLTNSRVTDSGLRQIALLGTLNGLQLNGTRVTDSGMEYVRPLRELELLDLNNTSITDGGLPNFYELNKLKVIDLSNTRVTDIGVTNLKRALPKLRVSRDNPAWPNTRPD